MISNTEQYKQLDIYYDLRSASVRLGSARMEGPQINIFIDHKHAIYTELHY